MLLPLCSKGMFFENIKLSFTHWFNFKYLVNFKDIVNLITICKSAIHAKFKFNLLLELLIINQYAMY
jgi:hypothetical protein